MVNGMARHHLAKIAADGSLDPEWTTGTDGPVNAMAVDDAGFVYVSGSFRAVNTVARIGLAKISLSASGEVDTAWDPGNCYGIGSISVDASGSLYVGGSFESIGSVPRINIARLSGVTGQVDASWNPGANDLVWEVIADHSDALYVAGLFTSIGGKQRNHLAKLSAQTGAADADWDPNVNTSGMVYALALSPTGDLYVGGYFSSIGGATRSNIAKLAGTGAGAAIAGWSPRPNSSVRTLYVDGADSIYAGGSFTSVNSLPHLRSAKLAANGNGFPDPNWNPEVNGGVESIAVMETGQVVIGGNFNLVNNEARWGAAVVSTKGASMTPADAEKFGSVDLLASQPNGGIIVAGSFLRADGVPRQNILRLQIDGTLDLEWNPGVNGWVNAIAASSTGAVYVAGGFSVIGGEARGGLAKLDGSGSGSADTNWNPTYSSGYVNTLALGADGSVVVGGTFSSISGIAQFGIAKLSGSGFGTPDTTWRPSINGEVADVIVDPLGDIYVAGYFSQSGHINRWGIAKISGSNGETDAKWNANSDSYVSRIALDASGAIYAYGGFTSIGGQSRLGLAKLLPGGLGLADPVWNPDREMDARSLVLDSFGDVYVSGWTLGTGTFGDVAVTKFSGSASGILLESYPVPGDQYDLYAEIDATNVLYVGGNFSMVAGEARHSLAAFDYHDEIFAAGFE